MFSSPAHLLQRARCFLPGCWLFPLAARQGGFLFSTVGARSSEPTFCLAGHALRLSHTPPWGLSSDARGSGAPAPERRLLSSRLSPFQYQQAQQAGKSLLQHSRFPLVTYRSLAGSAQLVCGPWLAGAGRATATARSWDPFAQPSATLAESSVQSALVVWLGRVPGLRTGFLTRQAWQSEPSSPVPSSPVAGPGCAQPPRAETQTQSPLRISKVTANAGGKAAPPLSHQKHAGKAEASPRPSTARPLVPFCSLPRELRASEQPLIALILSWPL